MNNIKGLNFGFIGVGQCGGNIANEFAKIGYKAIAINTSLTDLAKLDHIQTNNRLLINVGVQGAGKNPEIGKGALEEHIDEVIHLIEQVFDNKMDMIFVCAGLGGGTGSGIAPLLAQILSEMGTKTGMITTIPSKIESPKVQIVALNAFEEISHIENIGCIFIVDNAKNNLPAQMGIKTKYSIVNENAAHKLDQVNEMTTRASDMAFDACDFQTLLESRGFAIITSVVIDDISELKESEVLAQNVRKAIKNSIFADTNFQQAKGCAFLFEMPEGGGNVLTEESFMKMQNELGTPFETFTGVYENKAKKREVALHIIITGLPFPTERLNEMQSKLESQASNIQGLFETSKTQSFNGNGKSLLDKFINPSVSAKPKTEGESTLDKLRKKKKGL